MIETVISIVIARLGELLLSRAQLKFAGEILSQFDDATNDLRQIRCFLKEAEKRAREGDAVFQDHVSEIRESAYDLEDVIATLILKEVIRRSKASTSALGRFSVPRLTNKIHGRIELHKASSEVEKISAKISKSRLRFQENKLIPSNEWDAGSSSSYKEKRELRRSYSHTIEDDIVGLEKHIRTLTDHLLDDNKVVSIYGMGGLGKTTLARKLYQSGAIHRHFNSRAWASVSQQCQERDVWEGIYIKLSSPSADERKEIKEMSDKEIAKRLYDLLKGKRCLVILDDIWSTSKWHLLKPAFPVTRRSRSTILLTTRNRSVAFCAGHRYTIGYELECLDQETSWKLFEKKLHFGRNAMTNPEDIEWMKSLGRRMLKHCAGLPLAIVLLSGVLSSKESVHEWYMLNKTFKFSKTKAKMLVKGDSGLSSILGLSYDELPNHLKLCFLFLAHFPNNYEIAVKDLCWLWVAEGFVSSEDLAYQCLNELVERSMVQVLKWGSVPGRIKTCGIHDLMRDLCLVNAEKENFLQTINFRNKDDEKYSSLASDSVQKRKDRRLSIYLDGEDAELLPSIKRRDESLRSLVCFDSAEGVSYKNVMELVIKKFHLLRVLKFDNVDSFCVGKLPKGIGKLPKGIGKLIHLRLLSLKNMKVGQLPSSIGDLECLQTLDLRVTHKGRVKIPNVFWKLRQLVHLYLPLSYEVRKGKLRLDNLSNLKTLVNIELESCSWNDVSQRIRLIKLKIRIDHHGTNILKLKSMDRLEWLQCLSVETINSMINFIQITSSCPQIHKLLLVGNVVKLPTYDQFPRNLIKLSLERSRLTVDPMPTLGKLPNLRILRLDVDAYVGNAMLCSRGGFPRLENLSILYLYSLEEWRVMNNALSRLRYLKIEGCNKLQTIPGRLRRSTTLSEIVIQWMPRDFKETILGYHGHNLVGPSLVFLNMSDSDFSGGSTSAVSEFSRGAISDVEP